MLRRSASVLFVSALAILASPWAPQVRAAEEPVALLVGVKGKVEVTPAGTKAAQRAALGRALNRGDRVQVGTSSGATLFFSDGNVIELAEKSALTIAGRLGTRKSAGPAAELSAEVFRSVSRGLVGGSRETGLVALAPMRGGDEAQASILLSPRRTELLDDRPSFDWRPVEGATRYRVMVSGDDGEIWQREVEAGPLDYPADAAALARGVQLLWEVEALSDRGPLRREETVFRVLPAADGERVRGQLERIEKAAGDLPTATVRYLAGSYLAGQGLHRDAIDQFQALSRLNPASPAPHEALGNLYRAVGLMDLAAAEFQQALSLTREP